MKNAVVDPQNSKSSFDECRSQLLTSLAVLPACQRHDSEADWFPAVDLLEEQREYVLFVDLPGLESGAVKIAVEGGVLSISGSRKVPSAADKPLRIERPQGRFSRLLPLPDDVCRDKIQGSFQNGTLTLHMPKVPDAAQGVAGSAQRKLGLSA
jgi:HSP20 family protein